MAMDIFDEIEAPTKKGDVFDQIDVFDALPTAASNEAPPELVEAARQGATLFDVATKPYQLDWSDIARERHANALVDRDALEREGFTIQAGRFPSEGITYAPPKGVRVTPEQQSRVKRVMEALTFEQEANKRNEGAQREEDIRVNREREGAMALSPGIFVERLGLSALPMTGGVLAARTLTSVAPAGAGLLTRAATQLAPVAGAFVGGGLTGIAQEKALAATETPEETQARQEYVARTGETPEGKLGDLAGMAAFFRPSMSTLSGALKGEEAALRNVGMGAGVMTGFTTASSALEGRMPTPRELLTGAVEGAVFSTPTRLARSLLGHRKMLRPLAPEEARVVATEGLDALETSQPSAKADLGAGAATVTEQSGQAKISPAEPTRNLGPGAANAEEFGPTTTIGTYNAAVDAQRAERGLPPLMSEGRKANQVVWDAAEARIETDADLPRRITEEIMDGSRKAVSAEDQAVLGWRMVELRNQRNQAADRLLDENLTPEEYNDAASKFHQSEIDLQRTEEADRKFGTEWGRTGQFRQRLLADDFTLGPMMGRATVAKGEPLTPEEARVVQAESETIQKAETARAERETVVDETQSAEAAKEAVRQEAAPTYSERFTKWAESKLAEFDQRAEQAHKELRELMGFASANPLQPKAVAALFHIAKAKIARAGFDLAKFTTEAVANFGEGVRPFIKPAWDRATKFFDANTGQKPPTAKQKAKQAAAAEEAVSTEDGIRAVVEGGETSLDNLAPYVKRLAKEYIRSGVNTVEGLEAKLTEFFKPLLPEVTPRQLRDAFSDYGKSSPAPTDPIKVTSAQLRSEAQKLSTLENLMKKEAGLRTGKQRVAQSDRSRALTKQINELKKELGIMDGDPATRLRSTLESMETRTANRIKDLRFEIAKGERTVRAKGQPPTSPKLEALRAELETVQAEHEAIFGKREVTPEQRLKAAIGAAERAEKVAQAELVDARKGVFKQPTVPGASRSAQLDAIRERTKAARAEIEELKALDPASQATAERQAINRRKTQLSNRIADLADRTAKGDFTPRQRKTLDVSKDPEAVRLKAEADAAKRDFNKRKFEWEQANRTRVKKFFDGITETLATSRSIITSADVSAPLRQGGFLLIGDLVFNPKRAARQLGTMFRQLVSEKGFQEAQAAIALRPNADLYQSSKLYFAEMDGKLSAREENMRSMLAEKIPAIGRIVRASNRAYTGFLNRQRADAFDAMVEAAGGKDALTPEDAQALASAVNTFTGRGSVGATMDRAADAAARVLFSPRLLASRFQILLGQPVVGGKAQAAVRAEIAKQYAKFAIGLAAIYGLGQMAGGTIEKDPRSPDAGKIKFGNTRIDPMAGLAQVSTFLARMTSGQSKSGGTVKAQKRSDTFTRFVRTKLAPIPGVAADFAAERTLDMQEPTVGSSLQRLTIPISYQDAPDIYREHGKVQGTVFQVLNLMGMGVQNYNKK
jgi:hypothetical protein